jgi:hypothetical protein
MMGTLFLLPTGSLQEATSDVWTVWACYGHFWKGLRSAQTRKPPETKMQVTASLVSRRMLTLNP